MTTPKAAKSLRSLADQIKALTAALEVAKLACDNNAMHAEQLAKERDAMAALIEQGRKDRGLLFKQSVTLRRERDILRSAICQTLNSNGHLADGEVCTLLALKVALRKVGLPWDGDAGDKL